MFICKIDETCGYGNYMTIGQCIDLLKTFDNDFLIISLLERLFIYRDPDCSLDVDDKLTRYEQSVIDGIIDHHNHYLNHIVEGD